MSGLREPFQTLPRQRHAAEFGIWIFLGTEILFFGGLFTGYAVYRFLYPAGFEAAGAETNIWYGTANTAILLTSSATMAVAVWAGRAGLRTQVMWGLVPTALLGLGFMVLKGLEYREDIAKSLIPGSPDFPMPQQGAEVFFSFYWIMTAVHAVHLSVGIAAVALTALRLYRGTLAWEGTGYLLVLGLYWSLIDVIWIFLYPLLYLMGR